MLYYYRYKASGIAGQLGNSENKYSNFYNN